MVTHLAWFLTPSGRKFSFGFASAASITAFGLQYFPHTFLLNKYRDMVSMYQLSQPVPVSEQVNRLWNDTMADLSLPEWEAKNVQPFTVFGFELFRAGTISSRYGAVIGVPINFTFTDVSTIDPSPILVNNEKIDWDSKEAKQLLEALVLSEDAQKYGMAREILMAQNNIPIISSIGASFVVSTTYLMCRTLNERLRLFQRPLPVRLFSYFANCLVGFVFWAMQVDYYNCYCESKTDSRIAELDERYTKGAIEFYNQILTRNSKLRTVLGKQGEKVFMPNGDEKFLFRQPRMSILERKKFFEDHLKTIGRNKESSDDDELIEQST